MLDALGHQESGVDPSVLRGVEFVGVAFHPLPVVFVPLPVLLGGVFGEARPVFFEHHGVVHGVVRADNLHEAGNDVPALVREVAGVLHGFASVVVREGEAVFLIDDDGIVGILDLSGPCTQHQFAIAGDGEREARFVQVLPLGILPDGDVTALQVAEGTHARLDGQAADGQVDEGGEDGEARGLGGGLCVVLQPMGEVVQFALVGCFACSFAPKGVPDLDEFLLDRFVGQDVGRLQLVQRVDGQLNVAHNGLSLSDTLYLYVPLFVPGLRASPNPWGRPFLKPWSQAKICLGMVEPSYPHGPGGTVNMLNTKYI